MWKSALGLVNVTYFNVCMLYFNFKKLIQKSWILNAKKSQECFHQFILLYDIPFYV